MKLNFLLTTDLAETYVSILDVLREAERDGKIAGEFSLKPTWGAIAKLAEYEARSTFSGLNADRLGAVDD